MVAEQPHPLATSIASAAEGRFPPVDGGWHRVPPWRPGLAAVVAFTGHAVLAVEPDVPDELLRSLGLDGFGGAHDPRVVAALAGPDGWIDSLDALLVARGTGRPGTPPGLVARPDLAEHPRVEFAARIRDGIEVLGHPDERRTAVAVLARGLAGLRELSFEVEPEHRGGGGRTLISGALSAVPSGELVVAAVSPGNAASVRALLASGFTPIGSMQLSQPGSGGSSAELSSTRGRR